MKNIILILAVIALTSCASDATIAYEKARYEANPHYQTDDVNPAYSYTPKDRNMVEYFACLFRYNQRFNSADSRFICE